MLGRRLSSTPSTGLLVVDLVVLWVAVPIVLDAEAPAWIRSFFGVVSVVAVVFVARLLRLVWREPAQRRADVRGSAVVPVYASRGTTPVATAWIDDLERRLVSRGYRVADAPIESLPGARVFRRSEFRVSWIFTQLHTFVVVIDVDHVDEAMLTGRGARSGEGALPQKGGLPRWLGSGLAVLPVVVCRTADDSALHAAASKPMTRFGAFELPILVLPERGRAVTSSQARLWGAVYQDFLGEQQRLVTGDLAGRTLPPGGQGLALGVVAAATVAVVVVGVLHVMVRLLGAIV